MQLPMMLEPKDLISVEINKTFLENSVFLYVPKFAYFMLILNKALLSVVVNIDM